MTMTGSSVFELLAQRLAVIVGGLRQAVAARGGREAAMVPLVVAVWGRVGRLQARFVALVARLRAGWRPVVRPSRAGRVRGAVAPAGLVLPRFHGWLGQAMPETRGFGLQLQALLAEPEMAALLATAPSALRVLRPLCRMLGVEAGPPLAPPAGGVRRPARMRAPAPPSAVAMICAAPIALPETEPAWAGVQGRAPPWDMRR